jgi:hypothetical protein
MSVFPNTGPSTPPAFADFNGCFRPILLKNSVLRIADFSFAICGRFRIVDMRRWRKSYENTSWRSSVRLTKARDRAQD